MGRRGYTRLKLRPGPPEPNHPTLPPLHPAVNPRANKPPIQAFRPKLVVYTEGVRFLAIEAEAFWLVDAIASYFGSPEMRAATAADERLADMQFWTLLVEANAAELSMVADVGVEPSIRQAMPFTDFPLPEIAIWAGFNGEFWTLYLPSEH